MILAETFRMGGHATHDEREARQMMDLAPRYDVSRGLAETYRRIADEL